MLKVSTRIYDELIEKVNLFDTWPGKAGKGDAFDRAAARVRATVLAPSLSGKLVLFLGFRVAAAFGCAKLVPLKWEWNDRLDARVAILPHPSGINRWFNDPANRERASRFMSSAWRKTCDRWKGAIVKKGYGVARYLGKKDYVHRIAWRKARGAIPQGILVCHHCDVRSCRNVHHLFLGTPKDNTRDAVSKGQRFGGKLTAKEEMKIITLVKTTRVSDLAVKFGVSRVAIYKIKRKAA